jgi:dihydrofolate reductase
VSAVGSVDAALALAASFAGEGEVMVIGGAAIYAAALPQARRLYLTEVHAAFEGDVHFPAFESRHWTERSRERHHQERPMPLDFSFVVLERVA